MRKHAIKMTPLLPLSLSYLVLNTPDHMHVAQDTRWVGPLPVVQSYIFDIGISLDVSLRQPI